MFNMDAKFWVRWPLTCAPCIVLSSALFSVIQFHWFLDFAKLSSSMAARGLCAFWDLSEIFVQPHYMLSLSPLPLWVITPFLQTSAYTSSYEEAPPLSPGELAPLLPCSMVLSIFFLLLQVRQLVILYLCDYLRTVPNHLPLLCYKLQYCLFFTSVSLNHSFVPSKCWIMNEW